MSIKIGNYLFDGPYTSTDRLEDRAGIYAILCQKGGESYPVDVGESATVKTRVENHERKDCWKNNCKGTLAIAVYYTLNLQQRGRMAIEQQIRAHYDVPCGEKRIFDNS